MYLLLGAYLGFDTEPFTWLPWKPFLLPHEKPILPINADLHKLFSNFHRWRSEKGLLTREVKPTRFVVSQVKESSSQTVRGWAGPSGINPVLQWAVERETRTGPDPPAPREQGALQITWSLKCGPFPYSDLQNFPSLCACFWTHMFENGLT